MTPTEVRLRLYRSGYHPLPLNFKNPNIRSGWQNGFNLNEGEIELWATSWPNATNTGILTRHTPVLDIDILDKEAAETAEALVAEQINSDYLLVRIGLPPKRAIPFQTSTPFAKINMPLIAPNGEEQKIEFLGDGQQIVVDGIHPDTKAPYSWHGGVLGEIARADLPSIDEAAARKLVDEIVELLIAQYGYRRKNERKTKSGNGYDHDGGGANWDEYLNNLIDHDYDAPFAMALLRSGMHEGAAVNFMRAAVRGLKNVDEDRRQRRLDEIPDMVRSARANIEEPAPKEEIKIFWHGDVDYRVSRPQLIADVLPEVGCGLLAGQWGLFKTFAAFEIAHSCVSSAPFIGHDVVRKGGVLFIALEGTNEVAIRLGAVIKERRMIQGKAPFCWIISCPYLSRHPRSVRGARQLWP